MAKKKQQRVAVPLDQLISQPRVWSRTLLANNSDVTANAVRKIINTILSRFQGFWNLQKMAEHRGDRQLYLNFISDDFVVKKKKESGYDEGDVVFKLRLSDIEDDNHYDRARAALNLLHFIDILVPDKENPEYWRTRSFADIRGKTEEDPVTKERKFVGTNFEVIIPRLVAENYLDISLHKGYIRLMSFPMFKLRSTSANDLYLFLSEKWNLGHASDTMVVSLAELRTRLGYVKSDRSDRSEMYMSWSKFCEKVLEPAKREMDSLAMVGGMPFTFTYEPLFCGHPVPKFKRPDSVRFTLSRTENGMKLIERSDYNAQSIAARDFMKNKFGLTNYQSRSFMKRVAPDMLSGLLSMMRKLHEDLTNGKINANSVPAVAYDKINEYITNQNEPLFAQAEEIRESGKERVHAKPNHEVPSGCRAANEEELEALASFKKALMEKTSTKPSMRQGFFDHVVNKLAIAYVKDDVLYLCRSNGVGVEYTSDWRQMVDCYDSYEEFINLLGKNFDINHVAFAV